MKIVYLIAIALVPVFCYAQLKMDSVDTITHKHIKQTYFERFHWYYLDIGGYDALIRFQKTDSLVSMQVRLTTSCGMYIRKNMPLIFVLSKIKGRDTVYNFALPSSNGLNAVDTILRTAQTTIANYYLPPNVVHDLLNNNVCSFRICTSDANTKDILQNSKDHFRNYVDFLFYRTYDGTRLLREDLQLLFDDKGLSLK
jgi:hypothetical protein